MLHISSNMIITINRGDTTDLSVPLFINAGDKLNPIRYQLADNDVVYFGLMEAEQPFEHALIRKAYTKDDVNEYGDVLITLTAEDTLNLLPGNYYYEIKLRKILLSESGIADGSIVDTIVERKKFTIVE